LLICYVNFRHWCAIFGRLRAASSAASRGEKKEFQRVLSVDSEKKLNTRQVRKRSTRRQRIETMKTKSAIVSAVVIACTFACENAWPADDAPALYKTKCANCHGANGEGKAAMKSPALKGSGITAEQVEKLLSQGIAGKKAPHGKAISGLKADQIKALAEYVSKFQ
jgi:cytochrome c553